MSSKKVGIMFAAVIGAIALGSFGIAATELTSSVLAQGQEFMAPLSGQEEVPPTNSQAIGIAEFTVIDFDSIEYTVNAEDIQGVTAGHIHSGKQGENGPVVVTLFEFDSPMNEVSRTGSITLDMLEGPIAQLSDLETAMSNGETYVNIHTEQNPDGEIRGQISGSSEAIMNNGNNTG